MTKILVFDSGVGCLAISQAIREQLNSVELHLLIDNAYFPYGEKPAADLECRVLNVLRHAMLTIKPDAIVIACNTASTLVLEQLRAEFDVPIVGVVPAVKPAAEQSQSHVIGVIATPATIQRDYTQSLIAEFAPHCEVIMQGSTELVYLAEDWAYQGKLDSKVLDELLTPFIDACQDRNMDTLVLACTHFPLLKKHIQDRVKHVKVVDSSAAIARQVQNVLAIDSTSDYSNQPDMLWHTDVIVRQIGEQSLMSQYDRQSLAISLD